jgi:putative transposase
MEVIDALEEARRAHDYSKANRVEKGSQFTSKELHLWAYTNRVTLDFRRPSKSTENAYAESFNARLGADWLAPARCSA